MYYNAVSLVRDDKDNAAFDVKKQKMQTDSNQ